MIGIEVKIYKYVASMLFLLSAFGCSQDNTGEKMSTNSSQPQTEIATLERLINFPVKPVTVKWQVNNVVVGQSTAPGPSDWGVVALINVKEEDLKILTAKTSPNTAASMPANAVQPWLAEIIKSKFKLDETGKFYTSQVATLNAEQFFKSPLLSGAAFVVSGNEILVYLQTQ